MQIGEKFNVLDHCLFYCKIPVQFSLIDWTDGKCTVTFWPSDLIVSLKKAFNTF